MIALTLKKAETILSYLFQPQEHKSRNQYRRTRGKFTNRWELSSTLLSNQWVKYKTERKKIKGYFKTQSILDKGGKNTQWRKDSLLSQWCWESWTAACKSMKLEYSLIPYTKYTQNALKT